MLPRDPRERMDPVRLSSSGASVPDEAAVLHAVAECLARGGSAAAGSVTTESRWHEDIAASSIDVVELLVELEDRWGVVIPDSDLRRMRTVGDLVAAVLRGTGRADGAA